MHADQRTAGYKIGLSGRDQFFIWDTVMYSRLYVCERTNVYCCGRCVEVCTLRWGGGHFFIMNLHICVCVFVRMSLHVFKQAREMWTGGRFWGEVFLLLLSGWFLLVLGLLVFAFGSASICTAPPRHLAEREGDQPR